MNPTNPQIDTVRLAKRVAEQFGCSRADATHYIEGGWISVDGVISELPGARVDATQTVALLDGAVLTPVEPITILFHKPAGLSHADMVSTVSASISADTRYADDKSGVNFLQRHLRDLTITSPLDGDASGLVILTQDYRIVRKLVDDANRIEHELVVEVGGSMKEGGIDLLQREASWNGKPLNSLKVSWQSEQRLRFALKGLQLGMIKHLCRQVDLDVIAIKRIRIGRIAMASLPVGRWRYLSDFERF